MCIFLVFVFVFIYMWSIVHMLYNWFFSLTNTSSHCVLICYLSCSILFYIWSQFKCFFGVSICIKHSSVFLLKATATERENKITHRTGPLCKQSSEWTVWKPSHPVFSCPWPLEEAPSFVLAGGFIWPYAVNSLWWGVRNHPVLGQQHSV